ncbi:MAG: RluA family pseudouridine synthase [Bacteroidales bacterium]|jgi:23S rRNA pseudouridine1911/1915/1917 synthase|nr:RluA family pseudouridine synthase [Bacteroidales bacterium]MDD2571258.1 RluA family pseudouridine synthase [Bacteroidales bacterium]MDD2811899.1 RluA family pseudouridine synthase [Bacteroidales bacterium]MDD3384133.1 RluA family pseudouridine synthase [Bacteroidales bacterium]MDD3812193.1 RluA family pseudouridine synthase [Bacteroidales bacterium]
MEILFEDNHLIAVNKQVSDLVQADQTGDEVMGDQIKAYLKKKYNKPGDVFLGVVHRLDRPVTGVVVFARTSKALTRMNNLFKEHQVKKTYWAVVRERPPEVEDDLLHYLLRDSKQNKSHAFNRPKNGAKEARLTYRLIGSTNNFYLLEVDLHTGRHHQIRSQLAKIGCPIKGDLKYGFARSNQGGGIHLHARKISFTHPVTKEEVVIVANPPVEDQLWQEFMMQAGD